ncbi:MAG: hypothetical protein KDD47_18425, partial [Acidobacteria bacterium]|nr:hypothetical protein [Acidobacteriota bacterium]
VIGGPLRGVIRIPSRLPQPEEGFLIRLSSIRKTRTGSGKNRSTSERVLWQDQLVLDRPLTGNALSGTVLPVLFAIPYDAEESNSENTDRQTIWRLEVEAEIPGVDLDQSFEVPVFRTDASSEGFVLEEGRLAEYERPLRLEDILRRRKAVAEDLPGGGRTYHFPPQGSMAQKLILGTLTVVLGLALGLMIRMGAGWVPLLVVGFFMLLMATSAYSLFTAQYRIEVERDRVTLQGGLFGLGEPRILPASDVRSWEVAGGTQQGTQMHHDLVLITTSGKRHVAVRGLRSRADAEALLEDIQGLFPS